MVDKRIGVNFGQRLRTAMAAADVDPGELAMTCGVKKETVRKWMTGEEVPGKNRNLLLYRTVHACPMWLWWPEPLGQMVLSDKEIAKVFPELVGAYSQLSGS